MEVNQHRTWAEIDLGAIEHNYRVICEQAQAPVLCVVKADAYGHGAVQVAKRLEKMDAPYFAVATIPEGVELREACLLYTSRGLLTSRSIFLNANSIKCALTCEKLRR